MSEKKKTEDHWHGSRAVIASDDPSGCIGKIGVILWAVGPHIRCRREPSAFGSPGTPNEECAPRGAPRGISVWEGGKSGGTYRAPTEEEWAAIREGRCPWEDGE